MFFKTVTAWSVALILVLIAANSLAQGESSDDARAHFDQGLSLYEDGEYEQAAIAFARAYEIKPSYRILFNIGQAEAELKHYALSLDAFTRYLTEGASEVPPERETIVRAEIKRLRTLVGMLRIDSSIDGAKIKVDNESKGETPLASSIFVDIGKHEVVISRGSEELLREVVRVAGGQTVTLEVAGGGTHDEPEPGPDAPEGEAPKRIWTWVALGVGAAAGIAGGAVGGASLSKKKALEGDCVDGHCPPSGEAEADTIKKMNLTADVLFGVAGAAIVTGVILFFVEPDDEPEATVSVTPAMTSGGGGFVVGGSF